MARLIAIHTVNLGRGKSAAPGGEFDVSDKDEVEALIAAGAARRKTREVSDDDHDADARKPLAGIIAMADTEGVTFAAFKAAAAEHLGDSTPAKKDEIVAALKARLAAS